MKNIKIIVGNWKMNPVSLEKAQAVFKGIEKGIKKNKKVLSIICPSFIHIAPLALVKNRASYIGAQNLFVESKGSFTGEVSVDMLKDLKVSHVILGHSERRKLGETDELINKKILLALKNKITPIFCIGETIRDDEGAYLAIIKDQIEKGLGGVSKQELSKIIIAYEPVWAIGATVAMSPRDVHETTILIKKIIADLYKVKERMKMSILYGGSVDASNAHAILTEGEADGLLIGRQSLEAESFLDIINTAH
jgi:triosephosphate isomerase